MGDVSLGSVKAKLEIDASGVEAGTARATKALESFRSGVESAGSSLEGLKGAYTQYSAAIAETGTALEIAGGVAASAAAGMALVVKVLADAAVSAAGYVEQLDKMSLVTGLSTNMLENLSKAATEADVSSQSLIRAVAKLEVAVGNDSKVIAELGLSLDELKRSSPEEMLKTVAERLLSMTDIAERNAAAQKLLGRSYMEALPALQQYLEAGNRFVNLTGDQKEALRAMDSALDANKTAWAELNTQLGAVASSPEVVDLINDMGSAVRELALVIRDNRESIGWFFGLLSMPFKATQAGENLRGLLQAAGEMAAGAESEGPAVKDIRKGAIFQPGMGTPGMPSDSELEAEKQGNAARDKAWKDTQASIKNAKKEAEELGKALLRSDKAFHDAAMRTWADWKKGADEATQKMVDYAVQASAMIGPTSGQLADKLKQLQFGAATRGGVEGMTPSELTNYIAQLKEMADTGRLGAEGMDEYAEAMAQAFNSGVIPMMADQWGDLSDKEIEAIRQAERYAQVLKLAGDISNVLGGLADVFDAIGISAESGLGKIVSGLQTAMASVQNFASQTTTSGKVGAGLSAAAGIYKTGQEKGKAAGVLGGAATGAMIGTMILPGWGTAIGAVVGAVIGLIGALRKPEYKKIMEDIGKSWGVSISQGLAKQIAQIEKTANVSRTMAELLNVSSIMSESGQDPREFTGKINDLMNAIASGAVPAQQGLAELSKAFGMVADAALKSGNIGDAALVGIIKRARELGEVTPEMKEFITGQLASAAEGVQKLVDVMPANTALLAGGQGALLAATFNAIAAEQGIVAASAALGPAYDHLMQQITEAGLEIPLALQSIGRQMELGKKPEFQAASSAAAATSQVIAGLGNAGYMDTAVLGGATDVAKQAFDQAKNAGATDKEAYQLIGGLLSDINNASIQSGQALSGLAQELISGAQAQGVVIQQDQLSVLVNIRDILAGGGYTPPGGGAGAGEGAPPSTGGGPGTEEQRAEIIRSRRGDWRSGNYAEGTGGIVDFGPGTPVTLHGREAVVTEKQLSSMGGGFSFNPTFNVDPLQSNEARADLSHFQVEDFIRQVRNNPMFQQILRDQGLR